VRVLVTGGAGFIGANLVEELLAVGHEVKVLDNISTGHRHNLSGVEDEVELIEGDLRSYERVHHAVRGCEVVFHQGALPSVPRSVQDPITTSEINVGGTLNVLLTARDEGVRRVVFASSSSIYGDAPGFPRTERQEPRPLAPYAVSKLAAEQYCRVFATVYGLETVSLRYFNVFGKRQDPASQYSAVIPRFIMAMREGRAPTIYGSGEQSRDFTHVDDVVAANLLAVQAPAATGGVFNIACGTHHSLNELVGSLNRLLDTDIEPIHVSPRPGDIERSWADIGLAREALGYEPEVDFENGLRRTLAAYNEDLPVPRSAAFGGRSRARGRRESEVQTQSEAEEQRAEAARRA
jgi:nucleoside-diphosphate-sugar epimerase